MILHTENAGYIDRNIYYIRPHVSRGGHIHAYFIRLLLKERGLLKRLRINTGFYTGFHVMAIIKWVDVRHRHHI